MHVGRPYPFLDDRWAYPMAFWPGFAPWKVYLEPSALPVEWVLLNTFFTVSEPGVPSGDRQSVVYPFASSIPDDTFSMNIVLYNNAADPNDRDVAYRLRLWLTADPTTFEQIAFCIPGLEFTTTSVFPDFWTESIDVPGGVPLPPPGSKPAPASWSIL